jgi:hypothetical protein
MDNQTNDSWAVVELMGHVTLAGRVTKPGEYGGLWQIDVPEGESFQTQFFGSQSVYRIRMVSEEIARAYAIPSHAVLEYDAPIVTREEHQAAMRRAEGEYIRLQSEVNELRRRLTAVNALPSGTSGQSATSFSGSWVMPADETEDEDEGRGGDPHETAED